MQERTAACVCGALTLTTSAEPTSVSICHCNACKARTGSAFSVNARFLRDECKVSGPVTHFTRSGDSGGHARFSFCPTCGTSLFWEPDGMPDNVVVAVGAFREQPLPAPWRMVYGDQKLPWVVIPDTITESY
jgi:hypothetical protein